MQSTDEYIMCSVRDGDLRKSAILFERYQVPIYNYFLRRNHKASTAEDLLQIVFERVIKYRLSYDVECNFRKWLYSIARNVGITEHNKMNSIVALSLDDSDVGYTSVIGAFEYRDALSRGLELLNEDERELLLMAKIEGLKYRDIAKTLGITEAHVKVKVYRSIKNLKEILINQLGYEYE